ncbi:hypothetical protein K438DRAFT_2010810 [Mycena galopus ATCC 62051]|nr:hypothetical protein K438DRAFT_2010810 [Mycena galopus ATCC 62051]
MGDSAAWDFRFSLPPLSASHHHARGTAGGPNRGVNHLCARRQAIFKEGSRVSSLTRCNTEFKFSWNSSETTGFGLCGKAV